jgi:hypothetical protein
LEVLREEVAGRSDRRQTGDASPATVPRLVVVEVRHRRRQFDGWCSGEK